MTQLSSAAKVALRALLRSATHFDQQPVLKALITRDPDIHVRMPADIHRAIATFLGSELRTHFLPSGVAGSQSLRSSVLAMHRSPPPGCNETDTPLACMRYLASLIQIGRKHKLAPASAASHRAGTAAGAAVDIRGTDGSSGSISLPELDGEARAQLLPLPEQGCLLLAHPLTSGGGQAGELLHGQAPFSFARSAMLVCGHSTSLGTYALCLNKPLPVKAGALALGSPLTRALVGELFSWPQPEAESSRELLRRWQAMYQVHRADPELGFREQIEAADTVDADPYTRLRLLLLEKGWFGEAAAAAAARSEAEAGDGSATTSFAAPASATEPSSASPAGSTGSGIGGTEGRHAATGGSDAGPGSHGHGAARVGSRTAQPHPPCQDDARHSAGAQDSLSSPAAAGEIRSDTGADVPPWLSSLAGAGRSPVQEANRAASAVDTQTPGEPIMTGDAATSDRLPAGGHPAAEPDTARQAQRQQAAAQPQQQQVGAARQQASHSGASQPAASGGSGRQAVGGSDTASQEGDGDTAEQLARDNTADSSATKQPAWGGVGGGGAAGRQTGDCTAGSSAATQQRPDQTGDSSAATQQRKDQRAARRRAEADRSWDALLMRFAESSLSKGGPLPSLQVLHRIPRLGGKCVLPPLLLDGSDGLYLGAGHVQGSICVHQMPFPCPQSDGCDACRYCAYAPPPSWHRRLVKSQMR